MLMKRILSALIGGPLLLLAAYYGGNALLILVIMLAVVGLYEFYNMQKGEYNPSLILLILGGAVFPFCFYFNKELIVPALMCYAFFSFLRILICFPDISISNVGIELMGAVYVGWGLSSILLLRQLPQGFLVVFYLFLAVWSTDTGAYFIGSYIGKHKFAPRISPKKTWEGVLGGLIFSVVVVYFFLNNVELYHGKILLYITPLVSIVGQLGDLFESTLKRSAGIKDSSNIIPGHGGILDRFDSTIMTAPLVFYLLVLLERV